MPRAGRQRQRHAFDAFGESRGGYLDFGHGRRRRPAPPGRDGRRDRRSIAAARDRGAVGVGRAQRADGRARESSRARRREEHRRACATCGRDPLRLPAARRARRRLGGRRVPPASTSMRTRSPRRPSARSPPDSSASSTAASSGRRPATRRRTSISRAATRGESPPSSPARRSTRASSRTRSEPHPPSRPSTPPGRRAAPRCCSRSARWHAPKASTDTLLAEWSESIPGLEERLAARRALGAGKGLALGRRDGGDRRGVRGRRRARRLPSRGRGRVSAATNVCSRIPACRSSTARSRAGARSTA